MIAFAVGVSHLLPEVHHVVGRAGITLVGVGFVHHSVASARLLLVKALAHVVYALVVHALGRRLVVVEVRLAHRCGGVACPGRHRAADDGRCSVFLWFVVVAVVAEHPFYHLETARQSEREADG